MPDDGILWANGFDAGRTFLFDLRDPPFNIYSFWGIIFAHLAARSIAAKYIFMTPAFRNFDSSFEEASRMVGCSTLRTIWRILIPILMPAILITLAISLTHALESFEIELILVEAAHISFARILERALRHPLPAPIDRGDRKAARAQIAHGLEIFLDELGAALEQADRALAPGRRRPAREAHGYAVAGLEHAGDDVVRHRIGGNGDKVHRGRPQRGVTPYSRADESLNQ